MAFMGWAARPLRPEWFRSCTSPPQIRYTPLITTEKGERTCHPSPPPCRFPAALTDPGAPAGHYRKVLPGGPDLCPGAGARPGAAGTKQPTGPRTMEKILVLLRHSLAEAHEDGGDLGTGGGAGGIQVPVHALHDALGHGPGHGIRLDSITSECEKVYVSNREISRIDILIIPQIFRFSSHFPEKSKLPHLCEKSTFSIPLSPSQSFHLAPEATR